MVERSRPLNSHAEPPARALASAPAINIWTFNDLLKRAEIAPKDVRLLRHRDEHAGRDIHQLWMEDRAAFEAYQCVQSTASHQRLAGAYWASFVAVGKSDSLFVGLYAVRQARASRSAAISADAEFDPRDGNKMVDRYVLEASPLLSDLIGRLYVEWGGGYRRWIQRADLQNKPVIEFRRAIEEARFPGYEHFRCHISELETLPVSWASALGASRGVYLLTCPRTGDHYVGAALGPEGFLGRWRAYLKSGHGGNVALKDREASNFRIAILQTAGSDASIDDILAMEARWKLTLQSRDIGLNRN